MAPSSPYGRAQCSRPAGPDSITLPSGRPLGPYTARVTEDAQPADRPPRSGPVGLRAGAVVLSLGGLAWWVAGATQPAAFVPIVILGVLAAGALLWYGWRRLPDDGEAELFRANVPRYNLLNLLQVVAIVLVVVLLGRVLGTPWFIPGAIAIVNGVHFLPLGRWFRQPAYARLGLVIVGIGIVGLLLGGWSASVPRTLLVVGLCVAVAMWTVPFGRLLALARDRRGPERAFHLHDDADDSEDADG